MRLAFIHCPAGDTSHRPEGRLERRMVCRISLPRHSGQIAKISCVAWPSGAAPSRQWMRRRQRDDMVILAPIREQHRRSPQSCARPRMTEELQDPGLQDPGL